MADWSKPETAYQSFRRYFQERGFDVEAVERATVSQASNFSPHSAEALRYMSEIVGVGAFVVRRIQQEPQRIVVFGNTALFSTYL